MPSLPVYAALRDAQTSRYSNNTVLRERERERERERKRLDADHKNDHQSVSAVLIHSQSVVDESGRTISCDMYQIAPVTKSSHNHNYHAHDYITLKSAHLWP